MIDIHLEGSLQPLRVVEPWETTATNMSSAASHGLMFFSCTKADGNPVAVAIQKINYLEQVD